MIPLKSALVLGAVGFFVFIVFDRYTRAIGWVESAGRLLVVAALLAMFRYPRSHRQPWLRVPAVARLAAAISTIASISTLIADGNPRFYAEAWPALLPIYFFSYGQMVMPLAESVIFGLALSWVG